MSDEKDDLVERLRTQPPIYGPRSTTQMLREEAADALEAKGVSLLAHQTEITYLNEQLELRTKERDAAESQLSTVRQMALEEAAKVADNFAYVELCADDTTAGSASAQPFQKAAAAIRALIQSPAPVPPAIVSGGEGGWQSIDTAPRDGTHIQIKYLSDDPKDVRWSQSRRGTGWHLINATEPLIVDHEPTHWRAPEPAKPPFAADALDGVPANPTVLTPKEG